MAGNGGVKFLQVSALGAVTIAAGAAIGYYVIGGAHPGRTAGTAAGIQETGTPPDTGSQSHSRTPHLRPTRISSDYTAPGAPRIRIIEARTPTLGSASPSPVIHHRSSDTTDIPTPDAEASQEAAKTASAPETASADTPATPAPSSNSSNSNANDAGANLTAPTGNGAASSSPTPAPPNAAPVKTAAPPTAPGDTEASQTGDANSSTQSSSVSKGTDSTKDSTVAKTGAVAQYRIQAGTFADSKNAHDYLNTLQSRGLDASLHAEHQGAQTVYHVQVGAYHDRSAAEDAAAAYRHNGVPVTVSPITP